MNRYCINTAEGPVHFLADTPNPATMLFHGFRRSPANLLSWRGSVPGASFALLPGHSDAPELSAISVQVWAQAWREAFDVIGHPQTLIGESLGAMLALCLPARRIVAVEPLLTVDHIWPQRVAMEQLRARGELGPEWAALFDGSFEWVLDRISAPTLVIAGKTPLLPRRALPEAPSLLTDEDFARYANHPLVRAERLEGGHNLMDENPEGVLRLAGEFLAADALT